MDATVLEVQSEGEGRWRLILDQTVFYPMGGGQPTDQGKLTINGAEVEVYMVMNKDGEIWHYLNSANPPGLNSQVHGVIDWERRYWNMKVHSAGHIVDFAVYQLGYSPEPLHPVKADHGKKPFIVYSGTLDKDIKEELHQKTNELVKQDLPLTAQYVPLDVLEKEVIYLQPGLPTNKPLRMLKLESVGAVADGGTQVNSTKEIGQINIDEITQEEGNTVVKYSVVPD